MKLLIATTNPGKFKEISMFLADLPIKLIGLKEAAITDRPQENGKTFAENAVLKAKFYAKKSGLPTIADDGGLEIDALGGEPGVRSHRWIDATRENDDEELINFTIKKLAGIPLSERGAQLHAVIAFAIPSGKVETREGIIRGIIPVKPAVARTPGFPYRSLLYLPEIFKFYNSDDLTPQEMDAYNHRKKTLDKLKPIIRKYLSK